MPVIYCAIDMFAMSQAIRIIDGENVITIYASAQDVPVTIAKLCQEKGISNIHFYGNDNYLKQIVEDTRLNYNLNYHRGNPLNIEVN